jgi:mRNA interferase HigB
MAGKRSAVRVIKKKTLKDFWEMPGCGDAEGPLTAWYNVVTQARWRHWADVKATYRTADKVGDCVVFNIAGNKYRLIARLRFQRLQRAYVLQVMTHKQYDAGRWKTEHGCHAPPPERSRRRR